MSRTRMLKLEFLRQGPSHNQLLSPLTPYIAICGNHEAETIHLPYEQQQFDLLKRVMRYQDGMSEEVRQIHLDQIGRMLGDLVSRVPGFSGDLAIENDEADLVDVHIVTSAAELALLPFEAMLVPAGAPGTGQPLVLQPVRAASVTRSVRRVGTVKLQVPRTPRVLFISAAPRGVGTIPDAAHLRALRRAAEHWEIKAPIVDVLPLASLEAVRDACRQKSYDYVHVLAHGRSLPGDYSRFGLAFHSDHDGESLEVIDGRQLADALRTTTRSGEDRRPQVVTVASCDGGQVGSVIPLGGSLAHALHEAEIPVVIASQLPLTQVGATWMTEVFYRKLLDGFDPRYALRDIRRRLRGRADAGHDWASIVAYTSLPEDADVVFTNSSYNSLIRTSSALLGQIDREQGYDQYDGPAPAQAQATGGVSEESMHLLDKRITKMRPAVEHHDRRRRIEQARGEALGLLASVEKRYGNLLFQEARSPKSKWTPQEREKGEQKGNELLRTARHHYIEGAQIALRLGWGGEHSLHWLATQAAALSKVLKDEAETARWIGIAEIAAGEDLRSPRRALVSWAHGSLAELALLQNQQPDDGFDRRACEHVRLLLETNPGKDFIRFSTKRQFDRYAGDWGAWLPQSRELAKKLAAMLKLPAQLKADH